jgi:hypothetical protein
MARYRRRATSYGYERAAEHIREAEELSQKLGGTDKDVKQWFFGLSSGRLKDIFEEYGRRYGADKQEYAQETWAKWKSGRVKMSGLVAGRLYDLLPPRMPASEKFKLSGNLWRHYGPTSHEVIRAASNVTAGELVLMATEHFERVVRAYRVPDMLSNRFTWLTGGDVRAQEELLNLHLRLEREFVVGALSHVMQSFLTRARAGAESVKYASETVTVGKHHFEVRIGQPPPVAKQSHPRPAAGARHISPGWIIGGIWLLLFLVAQALRLLHG